MYTFTSTYTSPDIPYIKRDRNPETGYEILKIWEESREPSEKKHLGGPLMITASTRSVLIGGRTH